MKQIIDYNVIADYGSDALSKKVVEAIRNGWQPLGGVSAFIHLVNSKQRFSLALVKYDSEQR